VSFYEPNPDVGPTGAEPGEFADDGPLTADDDLDEDGDADPTRRPTGSPPLAE
jgi:hypothetical protein